MSHQPINRRTILAGAAAIGAVVAAPAIVRAQAKFQLKFSTTAAVVNPIAIRLTEAADRIRTQTNGEIDIKIFPAGQLGGEMDSLNQLRAGAIDFTQLSTVSLSTILPPVAVSGVGFAFSSYDQVWAAMDGDLGAYMRGLMAKVNLVGINGVLDYGFRHMTSTNKPIRVADDLNGFKMRVPPGPLWTSLFKALGAAPTTIPIAEVYTGLRTGLIDGTDLPLLTMIVDLKVHEVQKNISFTRHMWDGPWMLANKTMWEGMSPAHIDIMQKSFYQAAKDQRNDVATFDKNFVDKPLPNLTIIQPDRDSFRKKLVSAGFYEDWKSKVGAEAWAILEKYTGKLS